jgi:hypothetical protein
MNPQHPESDFIHAICRDRSLEHAFLLALLGRKNVERQRLLRHWASQIDWRRFEHITSPDLFAYLGHVLKEVGLLEACPASLQQKFRDRRRFTAAQWLRWRFEIHEIVDLFREHDVDLILLKGAVLTAVAYPNTSLRSMSDLDLLVPEADVERALRVLNAAGYRCPEYFRFVHPHGAEFGREAGGEVAVPLQKMGTRAFVEVHTQLESAEPAYPVPSAQLWEGAEEVDLCGISCRTLEKHEFLLHVILHLADHHVFEYGLRALLDVHLWIERHEGHFDWCRLAAEAVRRGYADWVYLSLRMVRDAFATPVPDAVFSYLGEPAQFPSMQRLAYEQVFAERRVKQPAVLIRALSQLDTFSAARLLIERIMPTRAAVSSNIVRSLSPPQVGGVGLAARRFMSEMRTRLPHYVRAWRAGRIRWGGLMEAARLMRKANQLRSLMHSQINSRDTKA